MTYYDIALLSGDADFISRVAAAYAVELLANPARENASQWATEHAWDMAAQPGFGEAYTYAINTEVESPGKNPGVITDSQILAAVQSLLA